MEVAATPSRADRLSRVVLALEEEFADILEQLCDEIRADLEDAEPDSHAEKELEECLEEIEEGKSSMYDAWNSLFHINMLYDLDAPGRVLTEMAEDN